MPGLYTITNRSDGEGISAAKYLADHQQHVDNLEPPKVDDYSGSISQMQAMTDPGEVGSESQATSLAGELERIRFAIKEIKGTAQWYESPAASLSVIPAGSRMLFDNDAAPTGWVRQTDGDDRVIRIQGTGTPAHGGSWTISGLTHDHTHTQQGSFSTSAESQNALDQLTGTGSIIALNHSHTVQIGGATSGVSSSVVTSAGTWRPLHRSVILCQKS